MTNQCGKGSSQADVVRLCRDADEDDGCLDEVWG